jgi:uncharacterized protein with von Willebrand factor type A (vWA) domain
LTSGPLAGVDRAAFCVALIANLRRAGISVGFSNLEILSAALGEVAPDSLGALYWTTRVTLIKREQDLARFDEVFAAVFETAHHQLDPHARRSALSPPPRPDEFAAPMPSARDSSNEQEGASWASAPRTTGALEPDDEGLAVPLRLPSSLRALADVPFPQFDDADLETLSVWLREAWARWPSRRSRRARPHHAGRRVALRPTLQRARRTGFEPIHVVRTRNLDKPRRVVMLCDVSQSMQSYATAYLHLMRAGVLNVDAEVFAFATSLTRLTTLLTHQSPDVAIHLATSTVVDRYGGTRIASNIRTMLRSRFGGCVRGAIVIIASDGWDSEEPHEMTAAMSRLRRRAHRVLWLNPRVSAPGFQPLVGSMAAALPFCDQFLAADTIRDLAGVIAAISNID